MPVREIETIDFYIAYTGKTITLSLQAHREMQHILEVEKEFNKTTSEYAEQIQKELVGLIPTITVKARTYRNTSEGSGYEVIEPRNYLTKEVIEIRVGSAEHIFFLGNFGAIGEAPFYIINKLKEQYERKPAQAETGRVRTDEERGVNLDRETINSVRLQFRKSQP